METPEEDIWGTNRKGRAQPRSDRTCGKSEMLGLSSSEASATRWFKGQSIALKIRNNSSEKDSQYLPV